ncbi:four helix bundle protein [Joostella sp. CR20]|uniref:four helix bundle protein n=1 Tax=Joostella sp. CR20 TaxID=2804312 RepID=UPI00313AEEF4
MSAKIQNYTDLDVWLKSRKLAKSIYQITKDFPKEELYGLVNQMRRSAVSICSNIAEGCGRQTNKDTIHFLYIARGSAYEIETQLYISRDLNYINEEKLECVLEEIEDCKKLINGFINYYKKL